MSNCLNCEKPIKICECRTELAVLKNIRVDLVKVVELLEAIIKGK